MPTGPVRFDPELRTAAELSAERARVGHELRR